MKSSNDEILRFIASSFRSVWALELLLLLKSDRRAWPHDELVVNLRASDLVVTKALETLEVAGLVANEGSEARYLPLSQPLEALVDEAEAYYRKRPDAVRRAIISATSHDAAAFADAFRLRKD